MAADEVIYTGVKGFRHHNNPSNTDYQFFGGIPLKVTHEDALHYAEEAKRGGPWKVDLGIVEQAVDAIKPNKPKGGKK